MTEIEQYVFAFCLFFSILYFSEKAWDWKIKEWNDKLVEKKRKKW